MMSAFCLHLASIRGVVYEHYGSSFISLFDSFAFNASIFKACNKQAYFIRTRSTVASSNSFLSSYKFVAKIRVFASGTRRHAKLSSPENKSGQVKEKYLKLTSL